MHEVNDSLAVLQYIFAPRTPLAGLILYYKWIVWAIRKRKKKRRWPCKCPKSIQKCENRSRTVVQIVEPCRTYVTNRMEKEKKTSQETSRNQNPGSQGSVPQIRKPLDPPLSPSWRHWHWALRLRRKVLVPPRSCEDHPLREALGHATNGVLGDLGRVNGTELGRGVDFGRSIPTLSSLKGVDHTAPSRNVRDGIVSTYGIPKSHGIKMAVKQAIPTNFKCKSNDQRIEAPTPLIHGENEAQQTTA